MPIYMPEMYEKSWQSKTKQKSNGRLLVLMVKCIFHRALNVPTSEYSFEDVIMMTRAKDMKIPFPGDIVEIERILRVLGYISQVVFQFEMHE